MALCRGCERAGAGQAARDPVLVGEVLAGLVDAARFEVRGGRGVPEPRLAEAVRDLGAGPVVVPEPRLREAVRDLGAGAVVVPEPRLPEAVRDLGPGPVGVPEPRSGGSSPAPAGPATSPCRRCGARAEWHRTVRGRWILIEPGDLPTRAVPAGSRWRVAGDGTAVQLGAACRPTPAGSATSTSARRLPRPPALRPCSPCGGATPDASPDVADSAVRPCGVPVSPAGRGPRWRSARRPPGRRRSPSPGSASG
ncbi:MULTISPECIES: DUF6083 domain-containing protein [Streptomyces]|nr:DUF6083 domain-containing protein [Streptomyces venezuelae]